MHVYRKRADGRGSDYVGWTGGRVRRANGPNAGSVDPGPWPPPDPRRPLVRLPKIMRRKG